MLRYTTDKRLHTSPRPPTRGEAALRDTFPKPKMGCSVSKPPAQDAPVTPTSEASPTKPPSSPSPAKAPVAAPTPTKTVSPPPVPPLQQKSPEQKTPVAAPLSCRTEGSDWDATPRTPRPVTPLSSDSDSDDSSDGEDDDRRCGRSTVEPDADDWFPAKLGIGGASQKCPPLQCGSCGFIVHRFRGHRWHRDIDYMHFRHFEGHSYDLGKLRAKLVPAAEYAAYSCQCAWQSTEKWKALDQWGSDPEPEGGAANGRIEWKKRKKGFNK